MIRTALTLFALFALAGCTSSPDRTYNGHSPQETLVRVIISFADPAFDPTDPAQLERLGTSTATTVSHLRSLSDNHHLMTFQGLVPDGNPAVLVDRLSHHPEIDLIQVDRRTRLQR